ncbi:hypothetical protein NFHSH190041_17400 [Shewanella sp. NFH-SH190041]|uniref:hypothetical protein n=1 Tax=Shewanella sp. NFH-SH190041 TaxID=2950245 RepID=UPI0021C2BD7B|nr:hypothetical protein [Shewanella sp. NFH-SH190041]BDM64288.1 hypothetical protein NFHSH190041_17400 [Shewanella sp. NFH-SH190041]
MAYAILAAHHSVGEAGIAAQVAYYRTLSDIVVLWHGAKQDTQLTDTELTDFSAKIIALLCQYCGCADDFAWLNSIPEALLSTTDYEKIVSGSALNRWF